MLKKLEEVLIALPDMLEDRSRWDSLVVNRRKPYTYRVFTYLPGGFRVCLHKFDPCHLHESFIHPHPWAGAFMILRGSYEMNVGYSADLKQAAMNDKAISLILTAGSKYEILDPRTWHSVTPLETTYTIMVNGEPWGSDVAHAQVRTTKGKDLDKMPEQELIEHLATFKQLLEAHT